MIDRRKETVPIFALLDKIIKIFEVAIAFLLLGVIAIKLLELVLGFARLEINILNMDFEKILSIMFYLIIGVEFIKMLYKHSPETVIFVLLMASARQIILYSESILHLPIGIISIAGLFAIRKFLLEKSK